MLTLQKRVALSTLVVAGLVVAAGIFGLSTSSAASAEAQDKPVVKYNHPADHVRPTGAEYDHPTDHK